MHLVLEMRSDVLRINHVNGFSIPIALADIVLVEFLVSFVMGCHEMEPVAGGVRSRKGLTDE